MLLYANITIGVLVLIGIMMVFMTQEKFYNKEINRWRPGFNFPVLKVELGKEIDFPKFQKHIRIIMIGTLAIFAIPTLWFMWITMINDYPKDYLGWEFWTYMAFVLVWTALIVWYTLIHFPKQYEKFKK